TTTAGMFSFTGLRPGNYRLHEQQRDNWRQTAPPGGAHTVTVRSGETATGRDFGNVCLGAVRVTVRDGSTNSTLTGFELRIEEVSVPGILENDPPLPRTTTAGGFEGLLPGSYRVIAFLPDRVYTTSADAMLVNGRWAIVKTVSVARCAPTAVDLSVVTKSMPGRVTGGMRMDVHGGWATAGFEFMTQGGEPRGSLEYQDHARTLNFHTKRIESITVVGNEAWIWGRVDVGGVPERFRLHLVDAGEPGTADRFDLDVAPAYGAGHRQTLFGGNVQVHRGP
ncbi:MAG: hypothetical protein M3203_16155, partial [Actinomycetota bacterium]|nr:hypothetical protein [Actinomycetota bacterium]